MNISENPHTRDESFIELIEDAAEDGIVVRTTKLLMKLELRSPLE